MLNLERSLPFALVLLMATSVAWGQPMAVDEETRVEFFEKKVRPVLVANCYNCHSANTNSRGGLRVDDRIGLVFGGDRGPAIVPGDPQRSLLIQVVRHTHAEVKMPPNRQLTEKEIAVLTQWVADGAAWPREKMPAAPNRADPAYDKLRQSHWAWQPLREPQAPQVKNASWPRGEIDRFLLARLEVEGISPVGDAALAPLIRRLTFDLTGLPPTPEEVDVFLQTAAEDRQLAIESLVDRLLASPAYGERWGRHWLDVARYGESTGSGAISRTLMPGDTATTRSMPSTATNRTTSFSASRSREISCRMDKNTRREELSGASG